MAELDLSQGESSAPRIKMGEVGTTGLKISNKQILEESKLELRWPNVIKTYKNMQKDATISSAINLFKMMLARIDWQVEAPQDATPDQEKKAKFIEQCMADMDHSWSEFIQDVTSAYTYGFSVQEKVYRKRRRDNGSRYDDGLVGWKKLPIRSQDTISGWIFSDDGRELLAVEQNLSTVSTYGRYNTLSQKSGNIIEIPRKKFMLFRVNPERDNPEGNSLLKSAYISWKYRTAIEEQEAIGVVRNMVGTPCVSIPPIYMSPDATVEQKAVYEYYKNMVRNLERNEQSGIILPNAYDPESRQPLFKFELLSVASGKQYDTTAIINRYDYKILTSLFADFLKLGQEQVGSFALAGSKTSVMAMAIEARLREIADTLNNDLIPQTFALNGWNDTDLPKFVYSDLDEEDIDEFGKLVQRVFSVNAIEFDREIANTIRKRGFKASPYPKDMPIQKDLLPQNETGASEGMEIGTTGNGTAKSTSTEDNSVSNVENS
jgi:hypothetical protein